jgi:hypothetical protein
MAHNRLGFVRLFQILLLLLRQRLSPCPNSLIHSFNATKANNGTANPLIDPGQCYVAHFPILLLGKLLHALDDRDIYLAESAPRGAFFLAFGARRVAVVSMGPREVAAAERCPLISVSGCFRNHS